MPTLDEHFFSIVIDSDRLPSICGIVLSSSGATGGGGGGEVS